MKIGSQSQSLVSLTSLLDASKQQQQVQRDDQQEKKLADSRDGRIAARKSERDELIQQNRDALKKIQDDLRLKNLQKLEQNDDVDSDDAKETNLNLRESFKPSSSSSNQPAFKKLGQIVDISI